MEQLIIEIQEDGMKINLMDGSSWSVNPGDSPTVCCWLPTQRIIIKNNKNSVYSYTIENIDTEQKVQAMPV